MAAQHHTTKHMYTSPHDTRCRQRPTGNHKREWSRSTSRLVLHCHAVTDLIHNTSLRDLQRRAPCVRWQWRRDDANGVSSSEPALVVSASVRQHFAAKLGLLTDTLIPTLILFPSPVLGRQLLCCTDAREDPARIPCAIIRPRPTWLALGGVSARPALLPCWPLAAQLCTPTPTPICACACACASPSARLGGRLARQLEQRDAAVGVAVENVADGRVPF